MAQSVPSDLLRSVINLEVTERGDALDDAITALDAQIRRWSEMELFAVGDTSFYIQSAETFDKVDYAQALGAGHAPVRLLIPILVVDQLDRLKKSKDGRVRGRARQTLAIIDDLFGDVTDRPTRLHPRGEAGGGLTVELVFDPPGHVRVDNDDDEIADRAVAVQALAGQALASGQLRFVTFDTSQSFRARHCGLRAVKLRDPDPEPGGRR